MISILLVVLVGLQQETIVVQELLFNVAHVILGWILSTLFSDFFFFFFFFFF